MNIQTNQLKSLVQEHGTPLYVYSLEQIRHYLDQVRILTNFVPLQIRYAMKANSHPEILSYYRDHGVWIDASSSYEVAKALELGFTGEQIQLSSQQRPHDYNLIHDNHVFYVACSLHQLEQRGQNFPGTNVWVRINPGIWSSLNSNKTNVGWPTSSFGIWHEYISQIHEIAARYDLTISKIHTHIGSGTDPDVWADVAQRSFDLLHQFPDATVINLGGGFKVARLEGEKTADFSVIGPKIQSVYNQFIQSTGKQLERVEIEPGTYLVANTGAIVTRVEDIVDTGSDGYQFIKCDTGMNDILRPTLYGAQHPIEIINDHTETADYVIVGHCCESWDILTPAPWDPEEITTRTLSKATIGDIIVIWWCGAYCASMSAVGYNSYPKTREVVL